MADDVDVPAQDGDLDDVLDGALGAAFGGGASSVGRSVLSRLGRPGASPPRVVLRDADGAPPAAPPAPNSPEGDSRYRLLGEIARGGVGIVLRGHDVDLGRDVALKILRDEYADAEDVLQRFVEEAQIGGQLQHPGIVPVYELGLLPDGKPFFTMKLVKGRTFAAVLAERPNPAHELARHLATFEAVCQTIAYAHARGVIHRDLKPANVMLGAFGEVHVVDWGMGKVMRSGGVHDERKQKRKAADRSKTLIATLRSDGSGMDSVTGSVMGTPRYMPPEQARGDVPRVDARSDVFSLGAILCEILTGRPPYAGGTEREALIAAAQAKLDAATSALEACGADEELVGIARTCLAPGQDARFADAGSLAKELAAYEAGLDERTRAAETAAATAKARVRAETRRRKLTIGLGSAAAVLVCGAGLSWVLVARGESQRREEASRAVASAVETVRAAQGRAAAAPTDLAVWDEVRAALKKAESAAKSSDADDESRASVEALRASLADGEKAARTLAAKHEAEATLVTRIDRALDTWLSDYDHHRCATTVREAFADFGIRIDEMDADAIARVVREEHPSATELVIDCLLRWADAERQDLSSDDRIAVRIRDAAVRASPNDVLARIEGAATADELRAIVATSRFEEMSTTGVTRLSQRLGNLGAPKDEADVYDSVAVRQPTSYRRHMGSAQRLSRLAPPPEGQVAGHAAAMRALRPESPNAVITAMAVRMRADNCRDCIEPLEEALAQHPDHSPLQDTLRQVYQQCGRDADAVPLARKAAARLPKDVELRQEYVEALARANRHEDALRAAEELVRDFPENAQALEARAFCKALSGDAVGSEADLRKSIWIDPSVYGSGFLLAVTLEQQGRTEEAFDALRHVVERNTERDRTQYRSTDPAFQSYAARLRLRGRLAEAETVCRKAIARRPDSTLFVEIARIQWAGGRTDAAIETLRDATAKLPRSMVIRGALAHLLTAAGRRAEALEVVRGVASARHLQPRDLVEAAKMYYVLADYETAEANFRQALAIAPSNAEALDGLTRCLTKLGRHEAAIAVATSALEAGGDQSSGRVWRAVARFEAGDKAGAREDVKLAILRGTYDARAWWVLGLTQYGEECVGNLTKAVNMAPDEALMRSSLSKALVNVGRLDEAVTQARAAVAYEPDQAAFHVELGRTLVWAGNAKEALEVLRAAAAMFPSDLDVQLELKNVCGVTGDVLGAWQAARKSVDLAPQSAVALRAMAVLLASRGRMPEALELAQRAAAAAPASAASLWTLTAVLEQCGDLVGAERSADESTRSFPEENLGSIQVCVLRLRRGDATGAESVARQGIEKCGEDRLLLQCIAEALLLQGRIDEAVDAFDDVQRCSQPLPKDGSVRDPAEEYAEVKRRADLRPRIAAILSGKPRPTPQELLDAAHLCCWRSDFGAATRLFVQAFQADPSLGDDDGKFKQDRLAAAVAAARAAESGDPATRNLGRARSLEWLRASHGAEAKRLADGDAAAARDIAHRVVRWTTDRDFAGVRGEAAFGSMPSAEQASWKALWADIAKLLADARAKGREEEP